MGSISRYNQIDQFIEAFGSTFTEHFHPLVGMTIDKLSDVTANHHVKGMVHLSNGDIYPVHHRWTDPDEDSENKELDEDFDKMEEYYAKHLIGKQILSVRLGHADRDDEVYILAHVDDEHCLEIPVGFDPEHRTISDLSETVLSEKQIKKFTENR